MSFLAVCKRFVGVATFMTHTPMCGGQAAEVRAEGLTTTDNKAEECLVVLSPAGSAYAAVSIKVMSVHTGYNRSVQGQC